MELFNDIKNVLIPEVILGVAILINFILSIFFGRMHFKLAKIICLLSLMFAIISTFFLQISPNYYAFYGSILSNAFTVFFKTLILCSGFLVVLLSRYKIRQKRDIAFDYFSLILTGMLAGLLIVGANDFLTMFIGFELLSFVMFILICVSNEAASKKLSQRYMLINGVSSALVLLGLGFIYAMTGSLNFTDIGQYLMTYPSGVIFILASIITFIGFSSKLFVSPIINWVSEVFEYSTYPTIAFFSIVALPTGICAFSRMYVFVFQYSFFNKLILALLAVMTITYAVLLMCKEDNMKRFLGYSTILQSGYMLLGLSVLSVYSLSSVIFYLCSYILAVGGVIASFALCDSSYGKNEIKECKGLAYTRPFFALALMGCLLSLTGIGFCSGFIAKVYLFSAIARAGFMFLPLLFIAFLSAIVAFYAYFKVIVIMFEKSDSEAELDRKIVSTKIILYACVTGLLILFIFPTKLVELCELIAYYI